MSRYMIHTCNARLWYVERYLLPSMLQQGILKSDITVYNDAAGDGNLTSTLKSFASLPEKGQTWHLQDDVIICSNFANITEYFPPVYNVVCGFCSIYDKDNVGGVKPIDMWYSFPCIRIDNNLAREFISWVRNEEDNNRHFLQISNNRFDDSLFSDFMKIMHPKAKVHNLAPNLVENIDYLIGGSTLSDRKEKIKSKFWYESDLVEKLNKDLS